MLCRTMAPRLQLEKAAWRWVETVKPEEISQEHIELAYRVNVPACKRGTCRYNLCFLTSTSDTSKCVLPSARNSWGHQELECSVDLLMFRSAQKYWSALESLTSCLFNRNLWRIQLHSVYTSRAQKSSLIRHIGFWGSVWSLYNLIWLCFSYI